MPTTVQPAPLHTATAVTNVPKHVAEELRFDRGLLTGPTGAAICPWCMEDANSAFCDCTPRKVADEPGAPDAISQQTVTFRLSPQARPDVEEADARFDEAQAADFFDEAVAR